MAGFDPRSQPESPYAWARLAASLALMTISGVGMYAIAVALPAVQAEFGTARSEASLPYAATMIGFGLGGILMGRLSDRFGVMVPVLIGAACLGLGFVAAGASSGLWQFTLAQGLLIGLLGTSSAFAPLVADASMWFTRRRGIAVAICASGNYLAGAVWPPILQHYFDTIGWRAAFTGVGIFCAATMIPLAFALRRKPPVLNVSGEIRAESQKRIDIRPNTLFALLCIAGVACCVAMSMPQVHIVAYCGDLGYAAARGAEMLSLMLGFGIVSRLASGWICDRIGGLRTLLLGSGLQGVALLMFLPFDSLVSLYVVAALFGLFQGGIVPSYAIIVREYFPPREAGARVGTVLMCTLLGMALGGWLTGVIFDLTGSYRAAFLNGIGWNLLNLAIALFLLRRSLANRTLLPA
ncbi:MAG: MFS transporter [Betaproteobacteria bacterium RBG_16_66_20]|nr:MAG: MFS transporter [Betaproteobacteria bacterium RBG_16_66_20]